MRAAGDGRHDERGPERLALLLFLATFLFVGALRAFLSSVYYDNLVALELGPSAAYALLLLAPALFLLRPPLRATLLAAGVALALSRALLAPTRGTPLHLPLAGIAAAAWLTLLGALLPTLRGRRAAAATVGIALGWALDVALLLMDHSADPTRGMRGLLLVLPAAAVLLLALWQMQRDPDAPPRERMAARGGWLAGAALGAWLFLQHTLAGNPYGAARWNGAEPALAVAGTLGGLALGAILVARLAFWPRAVLVALHVGAVLALLDHAYLHSPVFPLLLVVLQVTLVVDLALLLPRATPRSLVLTGFLALLLHFLYAFTFLFEYVPLGTLWEGRAPLVYLAAGALLLATALPMRATWERPRLGRTLFTLVLIPLAIGLLAAASPGTPVAAPREGELRVLTFNVHQGFANDGTLDASVFLPVLQAADADVVFLQEADTPRFTSGNVDIAGYLASELGYHLIYGQPTRAQAFGGAILSRLPILEWHVHELPSESDDRWYTEARLDAGDEELWVYAVHFALPHEDRMAQARALLAHAATREGPIILAGDFNSCPGGLCAGYEEGVSDDVYELMTASYQDAWVAAGRAADDPEGYTYEANDPHERIDHIYVSSGVTVTSVERVYTPEARAASDHLPVMAEIRLG